MLLLLQPKPFNNEPYAADHPDAALRGKPVIPGPYKNGKEYPVKQGDKAGWVGSSKVGVGRVVTYDSDGKKKWSVIAHDNSRKGGKHDHYLATKVPRNFFDADYE